jgi:hypothetical protein
MPLGASRFGLLGGVADLGKLELIETQTVSSAVAQVDFTSIQESTYNVHFLTWNNLHQGTDNKKVQVQLYESGVLETASVYQIANQFGRADGTFVEAKSTGTSAIRLTGNNGNATNETSNGYFYGYNFGNSSKYSFLTLQSSSSDTSGSVQFDFGSGVLPQASTVDGIRLNLTGGNIESAVVSLYGIAES